MPAYHRTFGNIPEHQVERSNWKKDKDLLATAQAARESGWSLKYELRRILGLAVMLEEAEAALGHAEERIAALETVNSEQEKRIKGLEMTVGRMKKRK